ncbi:GspH/FimT family pseudopilin [Marinobacterium stanieri]|uniref:GspH/FimT family pseudopilin n=1 Tax=Marinobacterium stanieri TaxID=49186 RepID=UPI0009D9CFC2|nr:GspH/FimT family pseudopilin [Marinobacterium stanieri]
MSVCLFFAPARQQGLSLVELMVAVAVLAIVIAVAPGSFISLVESNRQDTAQNEITSLLNLVRSTAISSNSRVTLCRTGNLQQCSGDIRIGSQRWQGAIAFIDLNQDRTVGAQETVLRVATFDDPVRIIWNRGDSLVYQPDGSVLGGSNGTFTITTPGSSYSNLVVVSLPGRIRIASTGS